MRPSAHPWCSHEALEAVVGGTDESSELVVDAPEPPTESVEPSPPVDGSVDASTIADPSSIADASSPVEMSTPADAAPPASDAPVVEDAWQIRDDYGERPRASSPDAFFSVGVGTLHNLGGNGNGSPIDSKAVVQTMGDLGALGNGDALRFDRSDYADIVPSDPTETFTGHGATGVSPLADSVPIADVVGLVQHHRAGTEITRLEELNRDLREAIDSPPLGMSPAMEQRRAALLQTSLVRAEAALEAERAHLKSLDPTLNAYRNPLFWGDPVKLFDETTRERQARLLLEQPITTLHRDAYGDQLPTRAEVVAAAATRYDLDPAVVGGLILQEQRDQSRREDAADILGATLAGRNTSIGLGQILMSTATANNADLLSDTVDAETRRTLTRDGVARLLTSDEHNIMATARYLRTVVADGGAEAGSVPGSLPKTRNLLRGLDTDLYRTNMWGENPDNIRAAGGEYTSRPWDDLAYPVYGEFVLNAVEDIRRAGVFGAR